MDSMCPAKWAMPVAVWPKWHWSSKAAVEPSSLSTLHPFWRQGRQRTDWRRGLSALVCANRTLTTNKAIRSQSWERKWGRVIDVENFSQLRHAPATLLPEASKGPCGLPKSIQTPWWALQACLVWAQPPFQPLPLQLQQCWRPCQPPAYYIWDAVQRALQQLSPLILTKTLPDGSIPISQTDGASRKSLPQSHSLGMLEPRTEPTGARPVSPTPTPPLPGYPPCLRNRTHLLGIVAVQVRLDSRVWNLLIDSYAFHGNPWTQSKPGNRLHCPGNTMESLHLGEVSGDPQCSTTLLEQAARGWECGARTCSLG